MRIGWAAGTAVAVLLSIASFLFGLPFASNLPDTIGLMLILVGLWTIAAAFTVVEAKDRNYYAGWGVVLAALSLFAYIQPNYALGALLIAVVLLILLAALSGRRGTVIGATNPGPASTGGTPAAE